MTIDTHRGRPHPRTPQAWRPSNQRAALPAVLGTGLATLACAWPTSAQAHVKWFSNVVNCGATPLSPLAVLGSPLFVMLVLGALLTLCIVFMVERHILPRFETLHQVHADWKQRFSRNAAWLLRIGVCVYFVSLFTQDGQGRIVLTPELKTAGSWVGPVQLLIAALVLWKRTVPLAVLGMLSLYAHGVWAAGWFHMLDYVYFLGAAAFLWLDATQGVAMHYIAFTLLRVSAGFSFMWVSIEKWLYPQWTYDILDHELAMVTMGLDKSFFVMSAGMVEFCLALLLVLGRLSSQVASLVLLALMVAAIPLVGVIDAIGHAPLMVVLFIFSASQNRIGYRAEAARRGADLGHVLTFALAVPGCMGLYTLMHALAYPGTGELPTWHTLLALLMSLPLLWRLWRTTPKLFPVRRRPWRELVTLSPQAA